VREDDLKSMLQAVVKRDGTAELLRWLARRIKGTAVLLDSSGAVARSFPDCPDRVLREIGGQINRVISGEWGAAAFSGPSSSWWARMASTDATRGGPALLVTAQAPPPSPDDGVLIAHAAALLHLCWQADERDRATYHIREAVLHLLFAGQTAAARRVAGAMKPDLAQTVHVYLVEGPVAARNAIADRCDAACGGRAWIIRCPVYRRHVIILCPSDDSEAPDDGLVSTLREAAGADVIIGAGDIVPLREVGVGYEMAYHALAVARHRPDRYAHFTRSDDLAAVLPPGARLWAEKELSRLLSYAPARPRDPDGEELLATLRSWLDFRGAAWRQLKVARSTLWERIGHIEILMDRDLSQLPVQAELHLALKLLNRPGGDTAGAAPGLDELLATPAARQWAQMTLAPLAKGKDRQLLDTVRAWLAADTRQETAATALGISDRGLRRRLLRAEQRLGRSLTGGPSARHDLQLALRVRGEVDAV
jgi:sugar diacid utilization regulator